MVAEWLPVVIGICGLGSLVFAALRFRHDDTATIVSTQSVVVHDMEVLTGQLRTALADCEEHARAR